MDSSLTQDHQMLEMKSNLFKAMGHPLRLSILQYLASGEKSVSRIAGEMGCKISNISRHLSKLRDAGAVMPRRSGLVVYYRLNLPFISQLLLKVRDDIGSFSTEMFDS